MQARFLSKQRRPWLANRDGLLYITYTLSLLRIDGLSSTMPYSDLKPENASVPFGRVWRENRGNWLLAVGIAASLLGCLVGYFNLIPEIEAIDVPNSPATFVSGNTLTVDISGCASDEGKVIAMLYDGRGFNDSSVPLRLEALEISHKQARWEIHNISYGSYAVYAFKIWMAMKRSS